MVEIGSALASDQQVVRLPRQACTYERGGCDDSMIHAARKTLQGYRALCDPALAVASLGGRFDVNDTASCANCAALVPPGTA